MLNSKLALPFMILSFGTSAFAGPSQMMVCSSLRGAKPSISFSATSTGEFDEQASAYLSIGELKGAIDDHTPNNDKNYSLLIDFSKKTFSIDAQISTDDTTAMYVKVQSLPSSVNVGRPILQSDGGTYQVAHFDALLTGGVTPYNAPFAAVSEVKVRCWADSKSAAVAPVPKPASGAPAAIEGKFQDSAQCAPLKQIVGTFYGTNDAITVCAGDLATADFTNGATSSALSDGKLYDIMGSYHEGTLSVNEVAKLSE